MAKLSELYFSTADLSAIEQAVRQAELRTSGELAVQIVDRSRDWFRQRLLFGSLFGLLGSGVSLLLTLKTTWGVYFDLTSSILWGIIGFAFGFLLVNLLWFWRTSARRRIVFALAKESFLELPKTNAESAVLVFVSLYEQDAEIVVDTAIAALVANEQWEEIDIRLTRELKAGRHAEGLVAAIGEIGQLMARHFPRQADDRNELPDAPRIG